MTSAIGSASCPGLRWKKWVQVTCRELFSCVAMHSSIVNKWLTPFSEISDLEIRDLRGNWKKELRTDYVRINVLHV